MVTLIYRSVFGSRGPRFDTKGASQIQKIGGMYSSIRHKLCLLTVQYEFCTVKMKKIQHFNLLFIGPIYISKLSKENT